MIYPASRITNAERPGWLSNVPYTSKLRQVVPACFSVVVMSTMTENNLGRKGFVPAFRGSQGRSFKQKTPRTSTYCLPLTCSAGFLLELRTACSGLTCPQWAWPPTKYQLRKQPIELAMEQSDQGSSSADFPSSQVTRFAASGQLKLTMTHIN